MKNLLQFVVVGLWVFAPISYAQSTPPVHIQFYSGAPNTCGGAPMGWFGHSEDGVHFSLEGPAISYYPPDGYLAFTWNFYDDLGTLGTGTYDSRTGQSTANPSGSAYDFTIGRVPYGHAVFDTAGSGRIRDNKGNDCFITFSGSTDPRASGGGYFNYTASIVKFRNDQKRLVVKMPNSFTVRGKTVIYKSPLTGPLYHN